MSGTAGDAARLADATLGGKDASVDYPARSILGVDYRLSGDTTLFAEYEHAEGDQIEADITRVGVRTRPWERTQVEFEHQHAGHRIRSAHLRELRSHAGLRVARNTGHSTSASTRRNTLRGPDLEPLNPNAPLASGSMTEDFFAAFVGASYRHELWQFTSRLEHRNSDTEERWSSTTGWYREPIEGHAMSVSLQAFDSERAARPIRPRPWAASPGRSARIRASGSCSTASS